jgi:hypothetical protein
LLEVEQTYLDINAGMGYNIGLYAAAPTRGRKRSAETIRKMSEGLKGRTMPEEARLKMIGRKHTPEARQKISEAGKRPCSEEPKRKIGIANTGRKLSPEHIEQLRAIHKGKPLSEETRRKLCISQKKRREREAQQRQVI